MRYQFGDVVLVPFPFTDQSTAKQRPGVIVSSAAYHGARRDLILMAVTSQIRGAGAFGELVVQDWQAAKLLKPSAIKPVLATLEQSLVIKTLGRLSPARSAALTRDDRDTLRVTPADPNRSQVATGSAPPLAPVFSLSRLLLLGPNGPQKPPRGYPAYLEERHLRHENRGAASVPLSPIAQH